MLIVYEDADCNGHTDRWLYQERYTNTCVPHHKTFASGNRSVVPARISIQSSRHCWRSPLPHASGLIQRDFRCVLGVEQTKQLPHVAKVDLVWQLGV
ncbi:hypothetical protein TNCV_1103921 [Trichonephila clavipes]|nr:hypothetical protein TNCV_1103921 [Trichonephila clavipes]